MQGSIDTEQQLLTALAAGERNATSDIYQQNFHIVSGWLMKNGGTSTDAADLFQEAMVVLFGKAQDLDFRLTCSISTYLMAVSKNLWYKKLQKQGRDPVVLKNSIGADDEESGVAYEDDIKVHQEREAHYDQLNTALDLVGEPCRSLLMSFYHKDKSMQEITADFGYTNPENAKNQKYKCLARLRKLFYNMQAK